MRNLGNPVVEVALGDGYVVLPLGWRPWPSKIPLWQPVRFLGKFGQYKPFACPALLSLEDFSRFLETNVTDKQSILGIHCHGSPERLRGTLAQSHQELIITREMIPEFFFPLLAQRPNGVILYACEAGRGEKSFAAALSKYLGECPVYASPDLITGRLGRFYCFEAGKQVPEKTLWKWWPGPLSRLPG